MNTYCKKKREFCKLMASVSELPITQAERRRMAKRGVAQDWQVHHILMRSQQGKDAIDNFALIKPEDHIALHKSLDRILKAQPEGFTEEDIPYLKIWTHHHNGYTLDMR